MRGVGLAIAAVSVLAVTGLFGEGLAGGDQGPASRTVLVDVQWWFRGVADHGRVLKIGYEAGACLHGDGRARVRETRTAVIVRVLEHDDVPLNAWTQCPLFHREKTLRVRLGSALGHRAVRGPGRRS